MEEDVYKKACSLKKNILRTKSSIENIKEKKTLEYWDYWAFKEDLLELLEIKVREWEKDFNAL